VNRVKGDLADYRLVERTLAEYEIDTVFHLAAQTVVSIANTSPYTTLQNNIESTMNLIEAVRVNNKVRHVTVASSDKAYGELDERRQYVETDAVNGLHPYDCSKSITDLISQTYIETYNLPIAITRCGNIYGGGDMNWSRLIPRTIRRILRGKLPEIWGSGNETRDYFFVKDCVDAYVLLSEREAVGPYNFSTGEEMTVKNVVEAICAEMSVPIQFDVRNNLDAEINYQWLDSTKARTNLGWKPKYKFKAGIKNTVQWYQDYLKG
jgi:CDP-glucose 4,6-dehydratase